MTFKRFLIEKLMLFFTLTTLITIAIYIVGSMFDKEALFGYQELLAPMRYAACCVLPTCVTYSRRELKPKELLARMILEFILIEIIILALAYQSPAIDTRRLSVVGTIAGSVCIIYVLARTISWLRDTVDAKRMNEDLLTFQEHHRETSKTNAPYVK